MLISRIQIVEYREFRSHIYLASSRVTQGSNLGLLLVLLFHNDVVNDITCRAYKNADDLKLAKVISTQADCLELPNNLEQTNLWCVKNKLDLNIDKGKKITFTRKNEVIVFYYNRNKSLIISSDQILDLGVLMDAALTFTLHIVQRANTALKALGFVIRNTREFN